MTVTMPVPEHCIPHPNPRFMKRFKRYEPTVMDHSAIIQAMWCKRRYFYTIVLGFRSKDEPQYFGFGSCYHKFREILSKQWLDAKRAGAVSTDLLKEEWMITAFGNAMHAAAELWKQKKMRDPVLGDKWDFLTLARLLESCTVAFKHWRDEREKGRIEILATEQNIIITLPDGSQVGGKADEIVKWNGQVWGRDFKTSTQNQDKWFTRKMDPNDQFTRYTYMEQKLCGEPVQGQLVEVMWNAAGTKKELKKGPKIFQHMATRSQSQLAMWEQEQMFYKKLLDLCRTEDIWPMETRACSYCEFHSVCSRPGEQAQMAKLEAEFIQRPWNFLERDVDEA